MGGRPAAPLVEGSDYVSAAERAATAELQALLRQAEEQQAAARVA